jgi:choline dehydrogenase-like flavoprotein
MLIDARGIPTGTALKADVAIVGAGAAGISLALELAGFGVDVCLLESGGTEPDWEDQALYAGRSVGLPHCPLDVCQLRYLGGNTNAWGGWCRPLEAIDFEPRSWVDDSGWPFPMTELAPYYRRAHEICQVTDNYALSTAVAELRHARASPLEFDPSRLETVIYRFSPPTRFGQEYRQRLKREASLRCLLHANVLGIETDASARSVHRLRVGTRGGVRFEVAARRYVLAAGGIENARLLLMSGGAASCGVGNRYDLVGRFYMDHPHTKRRLLVPTRKLSSGLYGELFRAQRIMARLALPEEVQRRERLLGYTANLHAVYFGHDSPGWAALRDIALSLSPSRRSDPFHRLPPYSRKEFSIRQWIDMVRHPTHTAAAGMLRILKPNRFISAFVLESKPEQAPNAASRVLLDDDLDSFGLRRIKVDWRMLPIDRRTAVRGEEIVDQELRRLGIGALVPLAPDEVEGWPDSLESGWHQLGTTRMHADERRGVVDANAQVHRVSNLYLTGGSVFPTGGTAPPTLTIVALAVRLAAHLERTMAAGSA